MSTDRPGTSWRSHEEPDMTPEQKAVVDRIMGLADNLADERAAAAAGLVPGHEPSTAIDPLRTAIEELAQQAAEWEGRAHAAMSLRNHEASSHRAMLAASPAVQEAPAAEHAADGWEAPDFRKAWQGGLTNEELEQWWRLKLPHVEATNRDICVFALGVEVGAGMGEAPKPDTALAASPAVQEAPAESLTLTIVELRDALEMCGSDDDEAETEVVLTRREPFTSTDGEAMAAGLYLHFGEYPEEGVIGPLGTSAEKGR